MCNLINTHTHTHTNLIIYQRMHTADDCFVLTTWQTLAMRMCLVKNKTAVLHFVIHLSSSCVSTPNIVLLSIVHQKWRIIERLSIEPETTRWTMRLCFVHDQTTAVWAFWCCVCMAVWRCVWVVCAVLELDHIFSYWIQYKTRNKSSSKRTKVEQVPLLCPVTFVRSQKLVR